MSLFGLESAALADGYTPLECFAILKCLDEEGDVVIVTRSTDGLKVWDIVGLLTVALDTTRQDASEAFRPDEDDER